MSAGTLTADVGAAPSSFAGVPLAESIEDLTAAIRSESWLDAGLAGGGVVLEGAGVVLDPVTSLTSAGLGWVMEHVEPLRGWLTDLTGDEAAVAAMAASWDRITAELETAAGDYGRVVRGDLDGMLGEGVEAYRRHARGLADDLSGLASAGGAVASALRTASGIVATVRELVRDALAELVGSAISWAAQAAATAGLGTPVVVAKVAGRVRSLVTRIAPKVTALIRSLAALTRLVGRVTGALGRLGSGTPRRLWVGIAERGRPRVVRASLRRPARAWEGLDLPDHPEPGTEAYALGYDPEIKRFRQNEYETARELMYLLNVRLTRLPEDSRGDWADEYGRTYDAVGNFPREYLRTRSQWASFEGRIVDHAEKADFVPVDVRTFDAEQVARVKKFIEGLDSGRYIIVGE